MAVPKRRRSRTKRLTRRSQDALTATTLATCPNCGGKGCNVCKGSGWIEMLGCGMVHPNVLRNCGIDPEEYSGFAFGFGIDRMVMLSYGLDDIRLLYESDMRFLNQF